jgi:capsular exopolysaccharide synthesis family protein
MQIPFLGHMPYFRAGKSLGEAWCEEMAADQYMTESVRVMRTTLLSRLNGRRGVTVLVSSAMAGTGKSSFTMILGRSIAQTGKKVLIVDADFYRMTLSKWFELIDRPGFMDALSAKSVQMGQLFTTRTAGLHVMPAGRRGDAPVVVEEIANGAFKACIGQLSKQYNYDVILFDSPPMLAVADAVILANQVDGTIMVERENLSQRGDVANALLRLNSIGGRLLGTVFVGSGTAEGYGRYRGVGYGYHYHETTKAKTGNDRSKPV